MNNNHKLLLVLLTLAIINPGCSRLFKERSYKSSKINTNNINSINNNPTTNIDTDIGAQLISSARSIEKSLATLAAAQELSNIPVLNTAPLLTTEGGMGGTADIDWTGPLEPLLEKIANMTDYNLKIMGTPTPVPIIVSITQSKAIVADILKNASLQAGKRVNIVVFPANRVIELRYRLGAYNTPSNNNDEVNNEKPATNGHKNG